MKLKNYLIKFKAAYKLVVVIPLMAVMSQASAQCPPDNVYLQTQAEVNQFAIDYPNCTIINGYLQIGANIQDASGDISDLSPLGNITQVNGRLYIQNNAILENVDGLNITTIQGFLYIGGDEETRTNHELKNLDGLSSLTSVGHDIYINYNQKLNDISGLQNTTFNPYQGYGLTIHQNPMLAVCDLPNFCTYLANDPTTHPRNIQGNLAECVNEQAVIDACEAQTISGCTDADPALPQWPFSTFVPTCTGSPEVIVNNAYTGEYSKVQLVAGGSYEFSSSVPTDFITITNEDATIIYAYGYGSVLGDADSNEVIRFYLHLDDDCSWGDDVDRSRIVTCDALSVNDLNASKLSIYPNPVKDILNISHSSAINTLTIINMLGQTVITQNINSENAQIDLSSLPKGNYFVKATSESGVKTVKIVKQ